MSLEVVPVVPVGKERCQPNLEIRELPRFYPVDDVEQAPTESESLESPDAHLAPHIVPDVIVVRGKAASRSENRVRVQSRAAPRGLPIHLRPEIDRQALDAIVRAGRRDLQPAPAPIRAAMLPTPPPWIAHVDETVALGDDLIPFLAIVQRLTVDPDC